MTSTINPLFEHRNPPGADIPPEKAVSLSGVQLDSRIYTSQYPIILTLETSRPNDAENSFTVSLFNCGGYYSSTLPKESPDHPGKRTRLHQHDYFELVYVNRGEMVQNIENSRHRYPAGSLCLLNRHVRHREEFDTAFQSAFLGIDSKLLEEILCASDSALFPGECAWQSAALHQFLHADMTSRLASREYMDFIPMENTEKEKKQMHDRFDQLIRHFVSPAPGSTYLVKGLLVHILAAVTDENLYRTVPIRVGTTQEAKIFDALSALMEKNGGRISRSQLERELHYKGAYLNQIVHKFTGLSIFAYGTSICMKRAASLLAETDLSVQEIADQLHFTNRTHFYRLFEETWKMTPQQYRRNRRHSGD